MKIDTGSKNTRMRILALAAVAACVALVCYMVLGLPGLETPAGYMAER
jgi:hypothetical protein